MPRVRCHRRGKQNPLASVAQTEMPRSSSRLENSPGIRSEIVPLPLGAPLAPAACGRPRGYYFVLVSNLMIPRSNAGADGKFRLSSCLARGRAAKCRTSSHLRNRPCTDPCRAWHGAGADSELDGGPGGPGRPRHLPQASGLSISLYRDRANTRGTESLQTLRWRAGGRWIRTLGPPKKSDIKMDDGVGHPAPGLSAAVPGRRWRAQMQVDGPLDDSR
jgi:hypothetical protein